MSTKKYNNVEYKINNLRYFFTYCLLYCTSGSKAFQDYGDLILRSVAEFLE